MSLSRISNADSDAYQNNLFIGNTVLTSNNSYSNVTLTDVQLASAYYPILVELAKKKNCVTYGELVEQAKKRYTNNPIVQNAIAVSTGRRLAVVRIFTNERNWPDLTSLVINKGGECGTGYTRNFDPKVARDRVFSFDWDSVTTDFVGFVKHTETVIKPRKKIKEPTARNLMAEYYKNNRESLPASIREHRELIIELIMEGFSPEDAFSQAMATISSNL